RLRVALASKGIDIKHASALEAAARLLGYFGWHAARRIASKNRLKLTAMSDMGREQLFTDWREIASTLRALCDEWLQQRPTRVFQVRFGPAYMMISVPVPKQDDGSADKVEMWPVLVVNPVGNDAGWLDDAPAALETLRRHLEETGKAIVDGVAVLHLCGTATDLLGGLLPQPVRARDVCNSELVLVRADDELDPGYEIARGDEMTCWSQFELAIDDHKTREVILDGGAWRVGAGRYVWQLSTLYPNDVVP